MRRRSVDRAFEESRRATVFAWLDEQMALHGDVLPLRVLETGAPFEGKRQPVMHRQRGIYQPAGSALALTLRTSLADPYGDRFDESDTLIYAMETGGPDTAGNRAAIAAHEAGLPLIYLRQVGTRRDPRFLVVHPVWIVAVYREASSLRVETETSASFRVEGASIVGEPGFSRRIERAYATRRIRVRLHQAAFRENVLDAYRSRCAMCHLRERQLLDAAHIVPDAHFEGDPVVSNGLALCRIHHGAFDAHMLSIEPETLEVRVLPRLLDAADGPMLRHGIQALQGRRILEPASTEDRPDRSRLGTHWSRFQQLAIG